MLTRSSAYARLAATRRAVVMMRVVVRGECELHAPKVSGSGAKCQIREFARYGRFGTGRTDWSIGTQTFRQSSPGLSGSHTWECNTLSVKTVRSACVTAVVDTADR